MTLFLSFRSLPRAGDIRNPPEILSLNGLAPQIDPTPAPLPRIPDELIAGRELVFATHGFNVNRDDGIHQLAGLEKLLNLDKSFVFIGVLWPGDWWVPVINYPSEADDANRTGRYLAQFIDAKLKRAGRVNFVSHSLGARVAFSAAAKVNHETREVCVLAAAADDDCLVRKQYAAALAHAKRVTVLASRADLVLALAYPVGDFASDVTYDDDSPWRAALGFHGPSPEHMERVDHSQISIWAKHGHGDYLPPADVLAPVPQAAQNTAQFVAEALACKRHDWP